MSLGKQATTSIITDVGDLYKRLLNHRPVIQNEVHFFLKEFELKREDSGLKDLQEAMKYANEMDTIFLEEIANSSHKFKQINAIIETVNGTGGHILNRESSNLDVPRVEQEALDKQVEECRRQYHDRQVHYDTEQAKHIELLKDEIRSEREAREKLKPPSQTTSLGSSVTIFPPEAGGSSESQSSASESPPEEQTSLTHDSGKSEKESLEVSKPEQQDANDSLSDNT